MSKIKDHIREDIVSILKDYLKDNKADTELDEERGLAVLLLHIFDSEI